MSGEGRADKRRESNRQLDQASVETCTDTSIRYAWPEMEDCKGNRDQFEKEMSDRLDMEKEKLAAAMAAQDDQGRPPVCGTAYAGKLERQPH